MPRDHAKARQYRKCGMESTYDFRPGKLVVPVCKRTGSTGPDVLILTSHAPYRLHRKRYVAAKVGGPPVIPTPADTPGSDAPDALQSQLPQTLLGASLSMPFPGQAGSNGNDRLWQVAGDYVFIEGTATTGGQATMPELSEGLPLGELPVYSPASMLGGVGNGIIAAAGVGAAVLSTIWQQPSQINFSNPAYILDQRISYFPFEFMDDTLAEVREATVPRVGQTRSISTDPGGQS